MEVPEMRYAKSGELNLAYQIFGSGPPLVLIPPLVSNVEMSWDHELYRRALEHVGRRATVLQFDKRGIGSSDRFDELPTLEQRIGDIAAVMDAGGIDRASLLGLSEGGLMAQLFAIEHPDRVDHLVLINSALGNGAPFTPWDQETAQVLIENFERFVETWGRDPTFMVEWMMPSQTGNESFVRWAGRLQRQTATPADIRRQVESVFALMAPPDLGRITAPTIVMHSSGDKVMPVSAGRYLADAIPDATFVEVAGDDHFAWVMPNWRDMTDHWLDLVVPGSRAASSVRQFATVLFTDLVDSTARSSSIGDAHWHETLDSHDRICRLVIDSLGGRMVKSTGDGLLATFATPSAGVAAAGSLARHLSAIGLPIRAGLHAGEIEVHDDGDVSGLAVNLAARVEHAADDGTVFVSSAVRDMLLGGDHRFVDQGEHDLKGIEGRWRLYSVEL